MAPAIGRHHAEWLSLVETSGPFLSVPVLAKALPQGVDAPDTDVTARLRAAREQLDDDPTLHRSWCDFVLHDVLELGDALVTGAQIPGGQEHRMPEHGDTVRPDLVVVDQVDGAPKPAMHITIHGSGQRLDRRIPDAAWSASPIDRLAALCRATGVSLGLTTNGRSWALVSARPGETTGVCTWDADLWLEEPLTLRAFRTLLGAHRFFSVAKDDTLPVLLEDSAKNQQEVTDRLGGQVRQAVELLIDALDRADRDRKGELLGEIPNEELYRAAVTMMMRLVFLFVAEERRLLPLDDPLYAESYAASTLREQLEERATRFGEDPLERSSAAWCRLLALSRAVHAGIDHEALRLPAYGGSLFDPDRYVFLEGRRDGTDWHDDDAAPLPVDDRTVLHLLTALQLLTEPGRAGQPPTSVRLSFRALDVEQIGHVYEGLLDHTAVRTFDPTLGLIGFSEEEIALSELETLLARDPLALAEQLVALRVKSSPPAVAKALSSEPDPDRVARLLVACDNNAELRDRVLPFLAVVRDDLRGYPRVFLPGSLYVTKTLERRSSGTYYTPRSLAEEVVQHALDPISYSPGPAEEADPAKWKLKPSAELLELKVADIAMGSGAFLVAACRYLAARLLEAWELPPMAAASDAGTTTQGLRDSLPADPLEREVLALRLVAERCLYGVDQNPMAVEMAKLSLWLVTLAKDRPFSFLDHALREGDSLLGITALAQVRAVHMDPARGRALHENLLGYTSAVGPAVDRALALRDELESFVVRDVRDAQRKSGLNRDAATALDDARLLADVVVAAALVSGTADELDTAIASIEMHVPRLLNEMASEDQRGIARQALFDRSQHWLRQGRVDSTLSRRCFHWPLEFPEVARAGGFDAIVGNPPFQGGKKISGSLGGLYREYVVRHIADRQKGNADLVAYFFLRASTIGRGLGLIASDSIAQGDTREVGLDKLVGLEWTIYRAIKSMPWPGSASLEVAKLWLQRGPWNGAFILDDASVDGITTLLEPTSRVVGTPQTLKIDGFAFQGSNLANSGFVLTASEAESLLTLDGRNQTVVRPYLGGRDLNETPDQSASRYVIDFRDWSYEEASEYPACLDLLAERVRPDVIAKAATYRGWPDRWWQFWNHRAQSYRAISDLERVLVIARVSNTVQPAFVSTGQVLDVQLVVFGYADDAHFGFLSSTFHWWWVVLHGSKRGVGGAPRYTPTDCFETLPQPRPVFGLATAGSLLDTHRSATMLERREGLTKTYNRMHDPKDTSSDIRRLRELHVGLDYAIRDAYGWTDIDLGHGFFETRQGVRHTFEPLVRQEILDRLLELNLERRASEEANGLHNKAASARKRTATASAQQTTMFGND